MIKESVKTAIEEKGKCCGRTEKTSFARKEWKKPVIEDVSGKIMAQPYIRFT